MINFFKRYEAMKKFSNAKYDAWEADIENEELEAEFDKAYKDEWNAFNDLVNAIVKYSNNQLTHKEVTTMLTKKYDETKALFEKEA